MNLSVRVYAVCMMTLVLSSCSDFKFVRSSVEIPVGGATEINDIAFRFRNQLTGEIETRSVPFHSTQYIPNDNFDGFVVRCNGTLSPRNDVHDIEVTTRGRDENGEVIEWFHAIRLEVRGSEIYIPIPDADYDITEWRITVLEVHSVDGGILNQRDTRSFRILRGDFNSDGLVNNFDLDSFRTMCDVASAFSDLNEDGRRCGSGFEADVAVLATLVAEGRRFDLD